MACVHEWKRNGSARTATRRACRLCGRREHKVLRLRKDGKGQQGIWYLSASDHGSAPTARSHPRVSEHLCTLYAHTNEEQLGYLAGLIDGDGCIVVRRRERRATKGDRARGASFIPIVNVAGEVTHLTELRDELRGIPGRVYIVRRQSGHLRAMAEWTVAGTQAVALLVALSSHLRLKRRQAETVLAMPMPRSRWAVTPELREKQEQARLLVQKFNQRGRGRKDRSHGS